MLGRVTTSEDLRRVFYTTRFSRVLNRLGYARFRYWWLYGERGLAGDAVAVWLYGEHQTIAFADEALAQYGVTYQPDRYHLAIVAELERFETPYHSLQPPLWELDAGDWLTVVRVAPYAPRRLRGAGGAVQPRLFPEDLVADAVN